MVIFGMSYRHNFSGFYSIYCILILSYVKLLFYDLTDKISNSCGLTDHPDMTIDVYSGRKTTMILRAHQTSKRCRL